MGKLKWVEKMRMNISNTLCICSKVVLFGCFLTSFAISSFVQAQNKVVVIPLGVDEGTRLERTVFVNGDKTALQNGAALKATIAEVAPKAFGANPWLIKLEPGEFDITGLNIVISNGIHLQGSGSANTTISSEDDNEMLVIDSDNTSISDLALTTLVGDNGDVKIEGGSVVTFRDIAYTGFERGLELRSCVAGTSEVNIFGSTFTVTQSTNQDNDIIVVSANCTVKIYSSQFFGGQDSGDGLFIGSGDLTLINSFVEDSTDAVNSGVSGTCRGTATSTAFLASTCP